MVSICPYISMTHRIHGAATYGVLWIPSIYPSHVSRYTSTCRIRHGWLPCLPSFLLRYRIPQDIAPYKDELGEWHPPRLSGRYKAQGVRLWIDEWGTNLEFINKQIEKKKYRGFRIFIDGLMGYRDWWRVNRTRQRQCAMLPSPASPRVCLVWVKIGDRKNRMDWIIQKTTCDIWMI